MPKTRTLSITLTVNEDYTALATETIKLPIDADITRIGQLVERKLAAMVETVADFFPREDPTPILIEGMTSIT